MKSQTKKRGPGGVRIDVGLFSKKDAAQKIAGGAQHVHSSMLGERDGCARATREALESGIVPTYPWEHRDKAETSAITSSADRYELISGLMGHPELKGRRVLRERMEIVLEELLTNALYHAYRTEDGSDKYPRKEAVRLDAPTETLQVSYSIHETGMYLSVRDRGGNFSFTDVACALGRCYGDSRKQIEAKESGAGLGLYMVFEAITHFKVECVQGSHTVISCWISDKKSYDPDTFSFNYFGGEPT